MLRWDFDWKYRKCIMNLGRRYQSWVRKLLRGPQNPFCAWFNLLGFALPLLGPVGAPHIGSLCLCEPQTLRLPGTEGQRGPQGPAACPCLWMRGGGEQVISGHLISPQVVRRASVLYTLEVHSRGPTGTHGN